MQTFEVVDENNGYKPVPKNDIRPDKATPPPPLPSIETAGKKYIVWVDYGYDGWSPTFCKTLQEAMNCDSYGSQKIITKIVEYKIVEQED